MHVGPSYSIFADITNAASADLGFKVEMQNAWTDAIMARVVGQPETIDIADLEFWAMQRIWRSEKLQTIDTAKITNWEKIIPLFREGKNFDGSEMSRQGTMPFEVQYAEAKGFAAAPNGKATMMPTIFNADTLGIRPDLIGRDVTSWAELLNPEFKGKVALINVPQIGIMDAAMAIEARGDIKYVDKGNMTRDEIDKTIAILIQAKKDGQFRAFWSSFDESVNFMASGEAVIQSMWSPAVTAVRGRGIDCVYKGLKEGYRGWGNGLGLMSHLDGIKLEAAYEYLNWMLTGPYGAFVARQGYYSAVPETTKAKLSPEEWDYWYAGKPAAVEIKDPFGTAMEKPGRSRDGGSFEERIGGIRCWNTTMDEGEYLVQRWNDFIAS
jgi:putative spermidine/putrescine transport system substrate-binding protein